MPDLFPLARPLLHALPPEAAHRLTLLALKAGLAPRARGPADPLLKTRLWGRDFANPIGLAAGFDKDGEVFDAMLRIGFGFVEVGGVTPEPQAGNPRPRVFRLPDQGAMINRLGLNSHGLAALRANLQRRRSTAPVGVNLGRNKDSRDPDADYRVLVRGLAGLADFLVINVSSPNTPGLRALQRHEPLQRLLAGALAARDETGQATPVLLKIAPDLTTEDRTDIARVALASGIDGLVVSNTTVARPAGLPAALAAEPGGLSGRPLMAPSTALLREMAGLTDRRLPIIGVGGVASGADVYAKIRAGASLVQLYTALVYRGPRLLAEIVGDLARRLRADGFSSVAAAVGADL
ncbi:MAG: quinone-dependent dihydroorotate dehydrogenase [Alphaproteobacteria bacterium]